MENDLPMYKNFKKKILKIISEEGFLSFFKKIIKYIGFKTVTIKRLIIFELDLQSFVEKTDTKIKIYFKIATEKDLDSMDEEHYGYNESGKRYSKNQHAKGDKCILAIKDEKIVGYVWIMKDHMELSSTNLIPIPSNKIYIYRGFVLKEYRGKRVLNAIDHYIIDMLKKDGKKFILTTVATNNKSSIKARERIGFKRIGKIVQFGFFGLKYDYLSKIDLSYLKNP